MAHIVVDDDNIVSQQVLLRINAANLPRHGILQALPDSYAVVSSVSVPNGQDGVNFDLSQTYVNNSLNGSNSHGQTKTEWGKTEIIKRSKNPQWTRTFTIDYEHGSEFFIFVQVFRFVNHKEEPISLGNAVFEIGDILGTKNHTKVKRLPKGGVVFCRLEPVHSTHVNKLLRFQFAAKDLNPCKRTLSAKSIPDTTFEIAKNDTSNASRHPWTTVYRSSPVKDSLEPVWDVGEVDLAVCCSGDLDRPIRLSVLEYHKKSRNVLIGLSETTVRAILNTQRDFNADEIERDQSINGFILQRGTDNMKRVGRLYVKLAQVIDNTYGEDISESICTDNGDDNSSRHGSVGNFDSPSTPRSMSFRDVTDPYAIDIAAIPAPVAAPATFQDYVQDGCQLDFCVAIDFTSSNGDPRIPGSLHDQNDDNLNDYEETISSIGNALAVYSELFNVWGFGAKFNGVTRHLFQCGSAGTVQGVEGILDAYKSVFRSDLTMSGPTVFDDVIRAAAVRAKKHHQSMELLKRYTVLLVVTDGFPTDGAIEETKRKLGVYGSVPLSVIFVGVGRSDFSVMHGLCDAECEQRKITTFVSFRHHQHDPTALGREALKNIPNQVVEYMLQNDIQPSKTTS